MELASIIHRYRTALNAKYASRMLPGHHRALHAITHCRTPHAGQLRVHCPGCDTQALRNQSCGHRSCPRCQNHQASQWLDRQHAKLLPVEYFMVTFTLPAQLRALAWCHQRTVYSVLFAAVASTLRDFGLNHRRLAGELGMTLVLHTHSRRLAYHPHCHVVVPGGAIDKARQQWRKHRGRYLFNNKALAKVFRGRLLHALSAEGLTLPTCIPDQWIVNCVPVGKGQSALQYLSRYLYRGVISERNIVSQRDGFVTFSYLESKTGQPQTRTLPGEDFLWLVLQHVLPKGFRRVRDYGFLHGNAKRTLALVQLVLQVFIEATTRRPRPVFRCPRCNSPMAILGFVLPHRRSG